MQTESISPLDWKDEFKNALRSSKELASFLEVPLPIQPFSVFIPKKFAQKIKSSGIKSALWNQFVPKDEENNLAGLLLLVDFEKAFDSLSWNFIHKVMRFFGFGHSIIKWVKVLYKKPTLAVIQGDNISSFLI